MILTAKSNNDNFEQHPESDCVGVCIDVTPLKSVQSDYGPRDVFKVVFETTELREDGRPFLVWSRSFTASLHEKAAFRIFLRQWLGRDLSVQELNEFDTETLIGKTARLSIVHNAHNGSIYANIGLIRPDTSNTPLNPHGKYVRVKDRDDSGNGTASAGAAESGDEVYVSWRRTNVHVGKHAGNALGDLDKEAIEPLVTKWMPEAKSDLEASPADRALIAALETAAKELGIRGADRESQPY